jgi:hypothetical protein
VGGGEVDVAAAAGAEYERGKVFLHRQDALTHEAQHHRDLDVRSVHACATPSQLMEEGLQPEKMLT